MKVVIAQANGRDGRRLASMVPAAGEASVVAIATNGADIIRIVLEEKPDVLILGPRLDSQQGLRVLHAVRPLLPVLRVVALGDRPSGEVRRAFLLGDIDLLLTGPDWADVISEVLQQWQHERPREPWARFTEARPRSRA